MILGVSPYLVDATVSNGTWIAFSDKQQFEFPERVSVTGVVGVFVRGFF